MGAPLEALTSFEIAVRGRGAAFFRRELVGVHRKAHRAAGFAPFKAGLDEDLVETLSFRLLLHKTRARYDHRVDIGVHSPSGDDLRRGAQILDAAIGAGA